MFSGYYHERLKKIQEEQQKSDKKHLKSLSAQIQFREQLAQNNRIRVEKRLTEMANEPIPINRHEFSLKLPNFKGESFIRAKPKDSKERVKAAEQDSSWLDPIPLLSSPHDFRPRHKSKELNHYMKYTPKDRYERLVDTWISQSNAVDHSWEVKQIHKPNPKLFPNTLKKSYYKTVETEALGAPLKSKRNSVEESSKTDRRLHEIAQEVLEKCKLKPLKEELQSINSRSSKISQDILYKNK